MKKEKTPIAIAEEIIISKIYNVRGKQVVLKRSPRNRLKTIKKKPLNKRDKVKTFI